MTNLIVEVSKYLMILLMAIYTYANFRFFSFPDLERKRKVCARQNRAMFLLHFLAYVEMYLKTEDETLRRMLLVFYMGQVVFFLFYTASGFVSCAKLYLPVYLQKCIKTSGK